MFITLGIVHIGSGIYRKNLTLSLFLIFVSFFVISPLNATRCKTMLSWLIYTGVESHRIPELFSTYMEGGTLALTSEELAATWVKNKNGKTKKVYRSPDGAWMAKINPKGDLEIHDPQYDELRAILADFLIPSVLLKTKDGLNVEVQPFAWQPPRYQGILWHWLYRKILKEVPGSRLSDKKSIFITAGKKRYHIWDLKGANLGIYQGKIVILDSQVSVEDIEEL